MSTLFTPLELGQLLLKNRIIMAPLTRGRAGADGVPSELMAQYYSQRATAGLIIAEATAVSADGRGWLNSPGLYTTQQQQGWQKIAQAVHRNEGKIFVQLWHMGATVHPDFVQGQQAVSASNITLNGTLATPLGRDKKFEAARALTPTEITLQVQNFVSAARRAIDAGLDGVEIHAANGFLIDQFTRDSSNQRTDEYGGSIHKRLRFMREVVAGVCKEIGSHKVGIRLSPTNNTWGISDSQYSQTFTTAVNQLNEFNLAYVHVLEPLPSDGSNMQYLTPLLRKNYNGLLLANAGYNQQRASDALKQGLADAVSFGLPFIANPDLVARFKNNVSLSDADSTRFYTPGPQGYVDYLPAKETG